MIHYANCRKAIDRFSRSGRLGDMGHVSCTVRQAAPAAGVDAVARQRALAAVAIGHLTEICQLFGWTPEAVMASFSERDARTFLQAFLVTREAVEVHCFVSAGDDRDEYELWLEGSGSSLRTNGNRVLWRNRGWPVFVPVRLGLFGGGRKTQTGEVDNDLIDALLQSSASRALQALAE